MHIFHNAVNHGAGEGLILTKCLLDALQDGFIACARRSLPLVGEVDIIDK